jgi:hypothetical protein
MWQEFGNRRKAQLFVARVHAFASWAKFARHVEGLGQAASAVSQFEAAVDAIVTGNTINLKRLVKANPKLVRARSLREHRSTLLHYVSANGVEDYRQKTPKNIVELAKVLLDAGADVNAESDVYGGGSTALGLTATSYHPDAAGVQLALMELLLARGGQIDGPDSGSGVVGCLQNGRKRAAVFLAEHGARLTLHGAAGVGRLDVLAGFFRRDGGLKRGTTKRELPDAFGAACQFGRTDAVEFLLRQGVKIDTKLRYASETGLHWAAFGGDAEMTQFLIRQGAPLEVKDQRHQGTPLEWALYGWGTAAPNKRKKREPYYEVVARLKQAGARLDFSWFVEARSPLRKKIERDPRMLAALRGEFAGQK